ncbi:MAG: S1 RNA-binding domain-containing protein, partial [Gemmatimonadetes bacterium]|nr:S1 RNA-binding domain-containing protein [Gemmatimonadota bacterium]
ESVGEQPAVEASAPVTPPPVPEKATPVEPPVPAPAVSAPEAAVAAPAPAPEPVPIPETVAAAAPDAKQEPATQVDMAQLLEGETTPTGAQIKAGERVSGVLVRIGEENSFIDFGGRAEGVLSTSELKGEDGALVFAIGEPLEAFVVSAEEEVRVSRFLKGEDREADLLYKAFKSGTPIEGRVMAVNKWGLGVEMAGTRAFCPISQIDTAFVKNPEEYRDKSMQFKIIRFRDRGRSIVLSRRALMEAEQEKHAVTVRGQITANAILTGKVTRLETFGAFVDLGHGVEGLVHVSELKHERVGHPQEVVESGQELKVKVLEVKSLGSRRKERISLSLKALEADPWGEVRSQFPQGSVVTGKVESLESYGAFVELAEGVRGLVHVSEMADKRVNHPRDVVSIGDEVKVAVVEIDNRRKRLRLSIKRAEQMEGETNLKEFADRQQQEQEEAGGANSAMLEALKRAQLIE